jgi:transposase-like protein
MSTGEKIDSGASEGARRATGDAPEFKARGAGRWSARRKVSGVLELLQGADLETLSRRYAVTAATLSDWREAFLSVGEAGLKSRATDVVDEEKQRLKSVVAELAMRNELLSEKIRHIEQKRPLAF